MGRRPRVAVAMCVFNGGGYLPLQLESIAAQTELPACMAIVDDGSTDGSWELLQQFAAQAPFPVLLYRNASRLGVSGNFEKAVRAALPHADVVFLSDQDDSWRPGKVAAFVDSFAADGQVGLVHSDADLIDGEGRPVGARLLQSLLVTSRERAEVARGEAWRAYARRNLVTGAACACRAEILQQALPFPAGWVHDDWIAMNASLVSEVRLLDEPWMAYRLHGGNAIGLPIPDLRWRLRRLRDALLLPQAPQQQRRLVRLEQIRQRAAQLHAAPAVVEGLERAIAHARHRANLSPALVRRAVAVRAQWRAGHYREWSSGRLAMLRDLVNPT